jgi:hypothetical protein
MWEVLYPLLEAVRALLPADIGNVVAESATNPDVEEHER